MSPAPDSDRIAGLAQLACLLEVSAAKSGNVTPLRAFADTSFEDFLLSAVAIGPAFREATTAGVGATVLRAIRDTRRLVRPNTNLGLVLLLAPLARAAGMEGGSLRARVRRVLAELTSADARDAFEAIRLCAPGGLGEVEAEDVRRQPTGTLREAMALASDRDSIAREYVSDFAATFEAVVPALRRALSPDRSYVEAIPEAFLHTLAALPDSLIARKLGAGVAREVSDGARAVLAADHATRADVLAAFDASLRDPGNRRNPGTTADLIGAGLFVVLLERLG